MKSVFRRSAFPFLLVSFLAVFSPLAWGQYTAVNLVSNTSVYNPVNTDTNLINGWGLAALRSSPFWISAQNTSTSPLYTAKGTIVALLVQIPCVTDTTGDTTVPCPLPGKGLLFEPNNGDFNFFGPSGIVANNFFRAGAFKIGASNAPALFIFSTLDGLIVGWSPLVNQTQGVVAVNSGAGYNGLAIAGPAENPHLYAANAVGGEIDVFDKKFKLVNSFAADPIVPSFFLPYGITAIGRKLYVTYFSVAESAGILDVCDLGDNDNDADDDVANPTCRRLFASIPSPSDTSAPVLASPWGIALAPRDFGPLGGELLVGNVDDGLIHAFDPESGRLIGTLNLADGKPFAVPGLWGLAFGKGSPANGPVNHLFFSAGPSPVSISDIVQQYGAGLFGVIKPPNKDDGDNGSDDK